VHNEASVRQAVKGGGQISMLRTFRTSILQNTHARTIRAGLLLLILCAAIPGAPSEGTITKIGTATGVAVSQVSVTYLKSNWVVTAVAGSNAYLQLDSWQYTASGIVHEFTRTTAQPISRVGIASISSSRVVTAIVTSDGNLQINVWTVNSAGAIVTEGLYVAGAAQTVDIAKLSSHRVVTAIKDGNGNLNLQVWGIGSTGVVTPLGSATDIAVSRASVAAISNRQFVTAAENSAGNLQLGSWAVDGGGNISHQADATKGSITRVGVSSWETSGEIGTAVRNGSGNLELFDWAVDPSTGAFTLNASRSGGAVDNNIALSTMGGSTGELFTAAEDSSGKLSVAAWGYNGFPPTFGKAASLEDHLATYMSATYLSTKFAESVTASINSAGKLEVDAWSWSTP